MMVRLLEVSSFVRVMEGEIELVNKQALSHVDDVEGKET